MILSRSRWAVLLELLCIFVLSSEGQNARSYDTNDWIPITPDSREAQDIDLNKRTTARVLNLDAPAQNFYPENQHEYRKGKPHQVQQFLRETIHSKANGRQRQRNRNQYKFEEPSKTQHFAKHEPKIATYEQPPPLDQSQYQQVPREMSSLTREHAPAADAPNIYEQYNIPFNQSYYQSLNPTSINQELLGEIQNTRLETAIPQAQEAPQTIPQKHEKESVQLVYVPLENLKDGSQLVTQNSETIFRQIKSPGQQFNLNNAKQHRLDNIQQDYLQQALQAQRLQQQIQLGQPILLQSTTTATPKTKKRKPHQPPLAVYMESKSKGDVSEVLDILKEAKSIAVQDSIRPDSPNIFIGPSTLTIPDGYSKFPLPYLNSLEGNRVERKIDQLPFFVAPLSYKTPQGYSKIPLPSPHVGSVVVSNKEDFHDKRSTAKQSLRQNQINEYKPLKEIYSVPVTANSEIVNKPLSYALRGNVQNHDEEEGEKYYLQGAVKQPQILQFGLGDNLKQFSVPTKTPAYNYKSSVNPYTLQRNELKTSPTQTNPNSPASVRNQNLHNQNYKNGDEYDDVSSFKTVGKEPINNQDKQVTSFSATESFNPYIIPKRPTLPTFNGENFKQFEVQSSSTPSQYNDHDSFISITPKLTLPTSNDRINKYFTPSTNIENFSNTRNPNIDPNPLELAINQYELHQINSELLDSKTKAPNSQFGFSPSYEVEVQKSSDPFEHNTNYEQSTLIPSTTTQLFREQYEEVKNTTPRPATKSRRRGKPTSQPVRSTTTEPLSKETYTILEEFSLRQPSTSKYSTELQTPKYKTSKYPEVPNYEAQKYIDNDKFTEQSNYSGGPKYLPEDQAKQEDQEILAEVLEIKSTTTKYTDTQRDLDSFRASVFDEVKPQKYENTKTEVEGIPANVYRLNVNHEVPSYTEIQPLNQHILNQNLMDQQILNVQSNYKNEMQEQSHFDPNIRPLIYNRGQNQPLNNEEKYKVGKEQEEINDYIKDLQDQSVRSLFAPSLVPSTNLVQQSTPKQAFELSTEEIIVTTTTAKPVETSTTSRTRSRGRTRGGSRYSVQSTTSRSVNKRRPIHSLRTTTEKIKTRAEYDGARNEPPSVTSKQKFRTRGRPLQQITERVSTTENEIRSAAEPTENTPEQSKESQSYMQFEHVINDQKITLIKPDEDPNQNSQGNAFDDKSIILQYENTATSAKPVVDIQINHPVSQQVHVQSGGVLHNTKEDKQVDRPARVRGRARIRTRTGTTTTSQRPETRSTRRTTTPISTISTAHKSLEKQSAEEEFYGFIRQPNFNRPEIHQSQVQEATEQPSIRLSYPDSYQSSTKQSSSGFQDIYQNTQSPQEYEDVSLDFNADRTETTPIQFVGELRPKYQNYEEPKTTTEIVRKTIRPKIRNRIRTSQRNSFETPTNHRQTYNDISSPKTTEQATRRSNMIKVRGRGNVHYRVPENLKQENDDEADVEGGNYPVEFLQTKQSIPHSITEKPPNFQITIDPNTEEDEIEDSDQAFNPSLYRPKFLPSPESWSQDTDYTVKENNEIESDNKVDEKDVNAIVTEGPLALPVIGVTELTTIDSNEAYTEHTKAIKEIFEGVNSQTPQSEESETDAPKRFKGRRRGVWKLVRQKPLDHFETAESQSYHTVLNSFDRIVKTNKPNIESESKGYHEAYNNYNPQLEQNSDSFDYESQKILPTEEPTTEINLDEKYESLKITDLPEIDTTTEQKFTTDAVTNTTPAAESTKSSGFFDSFYQMLGMSEEDQLDGISPTTTISAHSTFPEEITDLPTTLPQNHTEGIKIETTTTPVTTTTNQESKVEATKHYEVEPWEMKAVRTSTSTEISHETEICYKGKCVKSDQKKKGVLKK